MPWKPRDARRHTRKANTAKTQRQWSSVANDARDRGEDEGTAVRMANAVVSRRSRRSSRSKRRSRR
jgi:hypothetical protein